MSEMFMRSGDVAKRVGVTVRALHHYHEIGLLIPGHLTEGGHRLYNHKDIQKLYQILALKDFGFTLEEIRDMLHTADPDPSLIVRLQLEKATEALTVQLSLCNALREVQQSLEARESPSVHDLAEIIMMMQAHTRQYLSDEQIQQLKQQYKSLSAQEAEQREQDWHSFIELLAKSRSENLAVDSPQAQKLARYWNEFVRSATGSDPALAKAVHRFHADNQNDHLRFGLTPELFQYLQRIRQAGESSADS
ncbi:MerR family transcriptional regulator [Cohnella xylanilytica]|uniref:MerR family transcriptional regulator n=1 Tax=Cohnella xylanilytica TaxID=557555 RepID=UPI001B20F5B3|nr:MerR family transcriptional regulator [Cohnella xylanilytica]GIO16519.1 MerR family transcriptional regulator [Cohnella xylanilytica]